MIIYYNQASLDYHIVIINSFNDTFQNYVGKRLIYKSTILSLNYAEYSYPRY